MRRLSIRTADGWTGCYPVCATGHFIERRLIERRLIERRFIELFTAVSSFAAIFGLRSF